ncbi:MAG TPA: SDR family oxidoreductase [Chloroflexota bacterium]|nr:SDR family oxidoreductase [Chloroflexota bacterium]
MQLSGAVVVVTGGTGGLGSRISHRFAACGARVAIAYLSRHDAAQELAAELLAAGASGTLAFQADVTDSDQIAALVERVVATWGRLDVLVNNAAYNYSVPFADLEGLTPELWDTILHANTTGPFLCSRAAAPVMRRQGTGRIVNIGSVAGFQPGGSSIAYAVSKAALAHLTRCLAVALAPEVLVNSVAPGLMEGTGVTLRLLPEQIRRSTEQAALRRVVDKDDVAEQVVTLARSDSTTGQNVVIDAGRFFH